MIGAFHHQFIPSTQPAPATCLLLLHGTGGDEHDLLSLGQQLDPNAALLSPRGQVLENGMPRFFRRLSEGVFDIEDLKARANELADWVNETSKAYKLDRGRITAVGYSNGANIASAMMLLRPDILSAAILLRPMVPFMPDELPDLSMVRVLVAGGRRDPIATPDQVQLLTSLLSKANADVTVHWSAGGHPIQQEDVQAARSWLMRPAINA